jgi:hypothetical protein
MTPSKLTIPLIIGILGTVTFDLSPIALGYGMTMNVCFVLFAGLMFVVSFWDRRVLGYATVLSACNPANQQANLSFSFMLAVLTILKESKAVSQVLWALGRRRWWRLFLAAFFLIGLSVLFWPPDMRSRITEVKQALSRLGYLVALPLAVGLTVRTRQDGIRAVSLLCLLAVALLAVFFLWGHVGMVTYRAPEGGGTFGVEQFIGNISLNFVRTQVCIVLAAFAAGTLALGLGTGLNLRGFLFCLVSCVCVFMIMQIASVGSAFSMACGMAMAAFGYFGSRPSPRRILLGVTFIAIVGAALFWAMSGSESVLTQRIENKLSAPEIDRAQYWEDGMKEISKTPFGEGWSYRTGHSDWQLYLLSYGWSTGLLYIAATASLFLSLCRSLLRQRGSVDCLSSTLLLVGLATLSVYSVNSILDMLSANIGYYETVWALILTSVTVVNIAEGTEQARMSNGGRISLLNYRSFSK